MTLLQALRYFFAQALLDMKRGWKVSLLAIVVTAVGLFLAGVLALLGRNVTGWLDDWGSRARVVVYMQPGSPAEALRAMERELGQAAQVASWTLVTPEEAEERLRARFSEAEELFTDLGVSPFPASFEIELEARTDEEGRQAWLSKMRRLPSVAGVDDDRQWIRQIALAADLLRLGAVTIGGLLLAGSVFIITSVIRLAALVHREEIKVLRLVGATEFFVKGPFVVEGVVQGFLGSLLALAGLATSFVFLSSRELPTVLSSLLLMEFLPFLWQVAIIAVGTVAGLTGGLLSLRRTAEGLW